MRILFEDSQILVCDKEAGLPVQSARIGTKDLVSILKNYLWEKSGNKGEPYLGVVHRLDQPVEGLLVFARTSRAAAALSAQVTDGRMKKIYQAVAWKEASGDGDSERNRQEKGILEDYLYKDSRTNCSRIVSKGTGGAKLARLEYEVLKTLPEAGGELDLVQIHLLTGRHHQIRVQMAGAGMPLAGDRKYAAGRIPEGMMKDSLALCAVSLELIHPGTGKRMTFQCKPEGSGFRRFADGGSPEGNAETCWPGAYV